MSARLFQKNCLPWPDYVGNNENTSSLFDRNPENILKRQEKAQLVKNLRRSCAIANNALGRSNSKDPPGWSERKVTNTKSIFQRRDRPKATNSSPINNEQDVKAMSRRDRVLQELNIIPSDKTPKSLIRPITSLSSRKRNLTYTVDQKKSLSNLKFEQECKRSLNFYKQNNGENYFKDNSRANDYKENLSHRLPSVDLTATKAEELELITAHDRKEDISKQGNSDRHPKSVGTDINTLYKDKFQTSKESYERNKLGIKKFSSQLPVLKRLSETTASSLTSSKNSTETKANKSLLPRRSVSALSCLRKDNYSSSARREFQKHSFSESDDKVFSDLELKTSCTNFGRVAKPCAVSITVTKPSLSSSEKSDSNAIINDDHCLEIEEIFDSSPENFQLSSELQNETKNTNETVLNSVLTQNNLDEVSFTQHEFQLKKENPKFSEDINQDDAAYCAGSCVVNTQTSFLCQDISFKSLQEILKQISQERKEINIAMDEISMLVQSKTKAIIERYESSIEPLENLVKLQLEKLASDNKIREVDETSCVAPSEAVNTSLNETCFRLADYKFLGTPMPTKKKRLARSLSHPQALTESQSFKNKKQPSISKLNTSDEKNSSYSAEELSPFTNLVGDCERESLVPMTPKTRHNLFNLKDNLNQQLDLLFD